jgi:hypothetical protein
MTTHIAGAILATILLLSFFAGPALAEPSAVNKNPKQAGKSPLKVFILAGQSNMQGQGIVTTTTLDEDRKEKPGTLAALLKDPAKAPLLKHLVDAKGNWAEAREDVWVYDINEFGVAKGSLSFGYGWNLYDKAWFGPELQFGQVMGDYYKNQVLIIKTAWGGKSLMVDFRPPSSGGEVGPFYKEMLKTVKKVLKNLKTEFPHYNGGGYELAGFAWWHGWNDFCTPNAPAEYETNMVNLIKDLRKDLKSPKLPVVIGEFTGVWGADCQDANAAAVRKAQANAAARPEFKGNVIFVKTHDFVRAVKDSPADEGYHENKNGETYFLVGDALAKGMIKLLPKK